MNKGKNRYTIIAWVLFWIGYTGFTPLAAAKTPPASDYLIGQNALLHGEYRQALRCFFQIYRQDPTNVYLQEQIAKVLLLAGDKTKTVQFVEKIRPSKDAYWLKSISYIEAFQKHDYQKALQLGQELLQQSNQPWLILLQCWAYQGLGEKQKAQEALGKFSQCTAHVGAAHYFTALFNILIGKKEEAKKEFKAALSATRWRKELPEFYMRGFVMYVKFLCKGGAEERVLKYLHSAEPSKPWLYSCPAQGPEKSLPLPIEMKDLQKVVANSFFYAATLYYSKQAMQEGAAYEQLGLQLYPSCDLGLYRQAILHYQLGDYKVARKYAGLVAKNSIYFINASIIFAHCQLLLHQEKKALTYLERQAKAHPQEGDYTRALAKIYLEKGKTSHALALLNHAIACQAVPNAKLYSQRAMIYIALKQYTKGFEDFEKALKFSPDEAEVLNYYGYSLLQYGKNFEKALTLLKKAHTLEPENSAVLDSLGWAYFKLNQYLKALETLKQAVFVDSKNYEAWEHLGEVYCKTGEGDKTIHAWKQALANCKEESARKRLRNKLKKRCVLPSTHTKLKKEFNAHARG